MKHCSKKETFILLFIFLLAMNQLEVLLPLLDKQKLKIVRTLVNSDEELYLRELAKKSGVPAATTFRILKQLIGADVVQQTQLKNTKFYFIERNERSKVFFQLLKEQMNPISFFIEKIKGAEGLQKVVLQGEGKENGANIILVGTKLDIHAITQLAEEIRKEYHFSITCLTLHPAQYKQMFQMGLSQGRTTVLMER